jgi:hypothetical protein
VLTTHTHDDFEYPSLRDNIDTKSWIAYEQNPYQTHGIKSKKLNRHVHKSVGSQVMNLCTNKKSSWSTVEVVFL